ncbi:LAME_0C08658g1_1 [Lachancea meyersii CBS 8951]|uniref:LAME_0C08658g1_1 n=1 Tax=Lachancea meyersii CBS 8951 TaxID=1266667 RepID=A0A1G4J3I6_9SACH|nr:LAME_0C08658g1_1 [Lachancea meyersii CBS 8951]
MSERQRGSEDDPNENSKLDEKPTFVAPGRSILKHKFVREDAEGENLTISDIPVSGYSQELQNSLNQNNTTSRISTSKLQSRLDRRVSFAPDVTLHRVDFVPQQSLNIREPRRRSAIQEPSYDSSNELAETAPSGNAGTRDGRISSSGSVDDQHAAYTPVFDREVSMEITQLFSKHSAKPVDSSEATENVEDMDMTEFREAHQPSKRKTVGHQSEDGPNSSVRELEMDHNIDEHDDMDITEPRKGETLASRLVSRAGKSEKPGPSSSQDLENEQSDMETTQPFRAPLKAAIKKSAVYAAHPSTQIDVPATQLTAGSLLSSEEMGIRLSQAVTSTQEGAEPYFESHPHQFQDLPAKRRKIVNSQDETSFSATNPDMDDDMELTMMERLSPIQISTNVVDDSYVGEMDKAFMRTPRRGSFEAEMGSPRDEKDFPSLSVFLDAIGMNVSQKNDDSEQVTKLVFVTLPRESHGLATENYKALYANMPILEIYAFCCKELLRRIQKSKNLFQELEDQIATSASPVLFKRYFEANAAQRQSMNKQMELLRSFSRLQAARVWFEWRLGHLKGIKNVLQENLMILKDELDVLSMRIKKVTEVNRKVLEIKQSIIKEVHLLKEGSKFQHTSPAIPDRIKIETLKSELRKELKELEETSEISRKAEALRNDINKIRLMIGQTHREISMMSAKVKQSTKFANREMPKLRAVFEVFQEISGVSLKGFAGSNLSIELRGSQISLKLDVEKKNAVDEVVVSIPEFSKSDISRELYKQGVQSAQRSSNTTTQLVVKLLVESEKVRQIVSEYNYLNLLFPCRTVTTPTGDLDIEIRFFDPVLKCCCIFCLPLSQFVTALQRQSNKAPKLHLKCIQEGLDQKSLLSRFRVNISPLLPWLDGAEIS